MTDLAGAKRASSPTDATWSKTMRLADSEFAAIFGEDITDSPPTPEEAPAATTTTDQPPPPPTEKSEAIAVEDPTGKFRGRFGAFILALRKACPQAVIEDVRATQAGFQVRTRFADRLLETLASHPDWAELSAARHVPRSPVVDMLVREVPTAITIEELKDDLRQHIGQGVCNVRRLFASTDGTVDRDRPIPVVAVSLEETAVPSLREWRIFGVLRPQVGSKPPRQSAPQCARCFSWSHRTGACPSSRRCAVCGDHSHLAAACTTTTRRCLNCGGQHSVRYRGCPARRQEEQRVREAVSVPTTRTFPSTRRVHQGVSFAQVAAAQPTAAPLPQRQPRGRRQLDVEDHVRYHAASPTPPPRTLHSRPPPLPPQPPRSPPRPTLSPAIRALRQREKEHLDNLDRVTVAQLRQPNPLLQRRARNLRRSLRSLRQHRFRLQAQREQDPNVIGTPPSQHQPEPLLLLQDALHTACNAIQDDRVRTLFAQLARTILELLATTAFST